MKFQRPWGNYQILVTSPSYQIKQITVNTGSRLSLQSHRYRAEHWYILKGTAEVQLDHEFHILNPNESIYIPVLSRHRVKSVGNSELIFLEVQTGSSFEEEDIMRYEDDFGRVT